MQWTNTDGTLKGSAQAIGTSGSPPDERTSTETIAISGTVNWSAISISFDGGPATFGTISGGQVTLDFPQPDGTLAPVTLHSAKAEKFNHAVQTLGHSLESSPDPEQHIA